MAALLLAGCATLPPPPLSPSPADCAVMMLAAGFIADTQPKLHLRPVTRDVEAMVRGRLTAEPPERWSPDADAYAIASLGYARHQQRSPPRATACPLEKNPFVPWRPGRAELMLSNPILSPAADFAVIDAAVFLPGRRVDLYRFMMSGPPEGGWDMHRITFDTAPAPIVR